MKRFPEIVRGQLPNGSVIRLRAGVDPRRSVERQPSLLNVAIAGLVRWLGPRKRLDDSAKSGGA